MSGALREIIAKFGFDIDDGKLETAKFNVENLAASVKNLADKLVGGSLNDSIKDWIGDVKEASGEFKGLAKLTGTSAADMQKWTTAATLSGASVESLGAGLRTLMRNVKGDTSLDALSEDAMGGAASGKKAQQAFKDLKIDVNEASGEMKSSTDLLTEVGLAIAKISNPAERAQMATKLLGKQGAQLLPLFSQGEKGLQEYLGKLEELGGGVSEEAQKALSDNSKASKEYNVATLSLKSAIVAAVLPAMTAKIKMLRDVAAWVSKAAKGTEIFKSAVFVLGVAMLITQRKAIMTAITTAIAWAPLLLLVLGLTLLVDDLWTAFKGGDSVIGRILDKILGVGAAKDIFGAMRKDLADLSDEIGKAPGLADKAWTAFSTIGESLRRFFVDELPEFFGLVLTDVLTIIGTKSSSIQDAIWAMVKGFGSKILDGGTEIGRDLVNGIINGLKNGWDDATGEFADLAESMKKSFKFVWGINSPSTEATDIVKDDILGAVVTAFANGAPRVQNAARDAFQPPHVNADAFLPTVSNNRGGDDNSQTSNRVEQRNTINVNVDGSGAGGLRGAVQDGLSLGFDDERRAMLAALEGTL